MRKAKKLLGWFQPRLDERGAEVPDPTPLSIPSGLKRPESMEEMLRRLVKSAYSDQARAAGLESFEEADDFDIEDDPVDPSTPFEPFFDPVLEREVTAADFMSPARQAGFREEYARKIVAKAPQQVPAKPAATPPAEKPSSASTAVSGGADA